MVLEVLDLPFVLLRLLARGERAQVAALAGFGIFLARINAELPGFEFSDHAEWDAARRSQVARPSAQHRFQGSRNRHAPTMQNPSMHQTT